MDDIDDCFMHYFDDIMSDFCNESISSDDDLEEILELILTEPRRKMKKYVANQEVTVPSYPEESFFENFRMSRTCVDNLCSLYKNSPSYHCREGFSIPPLDEILIFLWYMGIEACNCRAVADRFDISLSTVNRITHKLTMFFSNLSPQVITWPDTKEKQEIEDHFRKTGFPGVIGAIDGTHFKIDRPNKDPHSYKNKKGYFSIQMQAVCDNKGKIRDIFVGYPGSVHDSEVFQNSTLCKNIEEMCGDYILLGDSGFPLCTNLMTPFKNRENLSKRQINYNMKLAKTRFVIEHCFRILRQKFRHVNHIKLRNVDMIVHFIRAACVLHNLAIDDNFPMNEEGHQDDENSMLDAAYDAASKNARQNLRGTADAIAVRNRISNNLSL